MRLVLSLVGQRPLPVLADSAQNQARQDFKKKFEKSQTVNFVNRNCLE
ncbi:hypothetical protein [Bordetella petrii]|nr:hypothetical protein [Bordetella petrii]